MKKILLLLCCMSFAAFGHGQVPMVEILKRALLVISETEKDGHQVLLLQVDVLKKDVRASQTYTLDSGSKYIVIALGDDRIKDIDLCIYDVNGNKIGCDSDSTNAGVVEVTPKWRGEFKFVVKAYAMEPGYSDGFNALIVIRVAD